MPEDPEPCERPVGRVGGEQRRLRVPLLEVLHDHRRLRQEPAVLLDDRNAAGLVLLVDPGGAFAQVDLDRLVLELLLDEHDADAGAVRAAGGVVERQHD